MNYRWLLREFRSLGSRVWMIILAVALGVGSVNGVHSLADSIRTAIQDQSRPLMAADIVSQSVHPFPEGYQTLSQEFDTSTTKEMLSMVSNAQFESLLAEVKGVSNDYPLYGNVSLESGDSLQSKLTPENAVVQRSVLKRLSLSIGDTLNINGQSYTISGVVESESDRVNIGMASGPRVFLSMQGLQRTGLEQFGSRITRRIQWKVADLEKDELLNSLKQLDEIHYFVRTQSANRANPSTSRSIDNSEKFLSVVALMSLLIGTIGVVQSLSNWLASRRREIAIFRCLGMVRSEIIKIYTAVVLLLGAGGSIIGIGLSYLGMYLLLQIVQPYIPIEIALQASWWNWCSAMILGVGVSILSTFPSILTMTQISAQSVLQDDSGNVTHLRWYWVGLYCILAFVTLYSQLHNSSWAAIATGVLGAVVLIVYGLVYVVQKWLQRRKYRSWTVRHAMRSISSSAFGFRTAMVSLTLGVMVITSIALMQEALTKQLQNVSMTSAPTNFFVDIQPDQWEQTNKILHDSGIQHLQSAPVVMGRLSQIKGISVANIIEDKPDSERWAFTREQRLSYDVIVDPQTILEGSFDEDSPSNALCLETRYASQLGVDIGDEITFNIQGIPIDFVVVATRRIQWETLQMNFFIVGKSDTLQEAPQFRLAAGQLTQENEAFVQSSLSKNLPNISVVSLRNIVQRVSVILNSIALAIQTMGAFSIAMGGLIMFSSIRSSLHHRRKQFKLLSVLGSAQNEITHMVFLELLITGILTGGLGGLLAWAATWGLLKFVFRLQTIPSIGLTVLSIGIVVGCISVLGRWIRPKN